MAYTATKEAKYSFEPKGVKLTTDSLMDHLRKIADKFPHANGHLHIEGELGEGGVVVRNGHNNVVAAVRSPEVIPTAITPGGVEFGGDQTTRHIETTIEKPVDAAETQLAARMVLAGLKQEGIGLDMISRNMTGLGAIGSEPEGVVLDRNGDLIDEPAGELQMGCVEDTMSPVSTRSQFLQARAAHILERKQRFGEETTVLDSSVSITSTPDRMRVANSGEIGPYVEAVQHLLYSRYLNCQEPHAREGMERLALAFGYDSYATMKTEMGNMAFWTMFASHASVGLHHRRLGLSGMYVPDKEAIYISDIYNSDLATLAEMLMMSTPVIFGETPTIKGQWPRDYRTMLKYTLDTAHSGPFIGDSQTMNDRISYGIRNGLSHTMDRTSYLAQAGERTVASMHGRVRNRKASSDPRNLTGRVEFTGCSSSASILDESARNSFLQILLVAAYEGLSQDAHPANYYAGRYPSLTSADNGMSLGQEAALHGFRTSNVSALIEEGVALCQDIGERYPVLSDQSQEVQWRLNNLLRDPAASLEEYVNNPVGPFCEVVQQEWLRNPDPVSLAKKIEAYQLAVATRILST